RTRPRPPFPTRRASDLFTIHPSPVSTLWPPNSILLAALLLAPMRTWAILLLAAFPAHLVIQLANHIPVTMILLWFISNCSQALIDRKSTRLNSSHDKIS